MKFHLSSDPTMPGNQPGLPPQMRSRNRLMLAVLEEALVTFSRGLTSENVRERLDFYEVDRWIASRDHDWPFSFENICSCLKIDPDYVRAGLRKLKRDAFATDVDLQATRRREEGLAEKGGPDEDATNRAPDV